MIIDDDLLLNKYFFVFSDYTVDYFAIIIIIIITDSIAKTCLAIAIN